MHSGARIALLLNGWYKEATNCKYRSRLETRQMSPRIAKGCLKLFRYPEVPGADENFKQDKTFQFFGMSIVMPRPPRK